MGKRTTSLEEKREPFLVHKNWCGSGKYDVTYYATDKSKQVTVKRFSNHKTAKNFAIKKAQDRGSKTYMEKVGTGHIKTRKVSTGAKKPKKTRKKKDPWAWTKKL